MRYNKKECICRCKRKDEAEEMIEYGKENRMKRETFDQIYALLQASLPEEEMRTKEDQWALLEQNAYHLLVEWGEDQKPRAFLAAWEIEPFRFIEHLVVDPGQRGAGIGGKLLDSYVMREKKDVLLEVELPKTNMAKRRIAFYERHGFVYHDFPYEQLPLKRGDLPLALRLMVFHKTLDAEQFQQYKKILHTTIYQKTTMSV